jgi:hypothetical protein
MTMTFNARPLCLSIALSAFLLPSAVLGQAMIPGASAPASANTEIGMADRGGKPYGSDHPQLHQTGMSGMRSGPPVMQRQDMPRIPYVTNPYGGMFGSMGNVYSPYYRQFHQSGMGGQSPGIPNVPGIRYDINPYAGMYGSMGNVYSPHYRPFHQSGFSGMANAPGPATVHGQGTRYHYPYFLPPTRGSR